MSYRLLFILNLSKITSAKIRDLFNCFAGQIREYIENTTVPYIMVTPEGIRPAKTFGKNYSFGNRPGYVGETFPRANDKLSDVTSLAKSVIDAMALIDNKSEKTRFTGMPKRTEKLRRHPA